MFLHGSFALVFVLVQQTSGIPVGTLHADSQIAAPVGKTSNFEVDTLHANAGTGAPIDREVLGTAQAPHLEARTLGQHVGPRRALSKKSEFSTLIPRADVTELPSSPREPTSPSGPSSLRVPSSLHEPASRHEPTSPHKPTSPHDSWSTSPDNPWRHQVTSDPALFLAPGNAIHFWPLEAPKWGEKPGPGDFDHLFQRVSPNPRTSDPAKDWSGHPYYIRRISGSTTAPEVLHEIKGFNSPRVFSDLRNVNHPDATVFGSMREVNQLPTAFKIRLGEMDQRWLKISPKRKHELAPNEEPWGAAELRHHMDAQTRTFEHHEPGDPHSAYARHEGQIRQNCNLEVWTGSCSSETETSGSAKRKEYSPKARHGAKSPLARPPIP